MKLNIWALLAPVILLSGCIGDDIIFDTVDERVSISTTLDSLMLGDTFQLEASYFNSIGEEEARDISWESTDNNILSVNQDGQVIGLELGEAEVIASALDQEGAMLEDKINIVVTEQATTVDDQERIGALQTTSSYVLEGDFVLRQEGGSLVLAFGDNYRASSNLPGLYLYMTNNPNSVNGALEVMEVTIFEGAHSYAIPNTVGLNDYNYLLLYCKPFGVKVGDGAFEE